jgi:copper chaperone
MPIFKVEDMSCGHCAATITRAVKDADGDAGVEIQIDEKRVSISSTLSADALADAIKEAGYTPVIAS